MSAASERAFTCAGCGTSWTVPVSTCPTCGRHSEDAYLRSTEANAKRLDEAMAEVYPASAESEREGLAALRHPDGGWLGITPRMADIILNHLHQSRAEIQAEAWDAAVEHIESTFGAMCRPAHNPYRIREGGDQ